MTKSVQPTTLNNKVITREIQTKNVKNGYGIIDRDSYRKPGLMGIVLVVPGCFQKSYWRLNNYFFIYFFLFINFSYNSYK